MEWNGLAVSNARHMAGQNWGATAKIGEEESKNSSWGSKL